MTWMLVLGATWLVAAALAALLIGRSIRLARGQSGDVVLDQSGDVVLDEPNFVVDQPVAQRQVDDRPLDRTVRDTPTIPGLPVARPRVPGTRPARTDRDRRTGTG